MFLSALQPIRSCPLRVLLVSHVILFFPPRLLFFHILELLAVSARCPKPCCMEAVELNLNSPAENELMYRKRSFQIEA
jgi:hypothetical protein